MLTLQSVRQAVTGAWILAVLLVGALTPARAVEMAVLDQAPAEAPVVIVVPSLSKLNQKIAMMNDAMGLHLPQLADALSTFKQSLGIGEGLREDGALIVALTSVEGMDGPGEPPMVLLMPVSDYATFVKNFHGDATQEIAALTMPGGQPGFVKKSEGYAVMGPKREVVEAYKPGNAAAALQKAAGKLGKRFMDGSDAFVFINLQLMAPKLQPKIQQELARAMERVGAQPGTQANPELAKAFMKMYGDATTAVLRDSTAAILGADINELGVGLTGTIQFKPDSAVAKLIPNGGESAGALVKLPNQPYLVATGIDFEGIAVKQIIDQALAYIPKDQGGAMLEMVRKSLPLVSLIKNVGQAYYVPAGGAAGGLGASLFNGVSIASVSDANAYVQGYKDYITSLNNLRIEMGDGAAPPPAGGANPPAEALVFNTKYTANALQIDGVSVDQFEIQYNLPRSVMQQMGQLGPLMMMLGGQGQSGYLATVGNQVVMTTTPNANLVRQALASLKEEKGLGAAETLSQVRANLPPKPTMEIYLSMAGIVSTANGFMGMMGQPPIQVPADLPPVGMGLSIEESGAAGRWFVPVPVVKFVMDTYNAMNAAGMGGRPGGPPAQPVQPRQGPQPAPF